MAGSPGGAPPPLDIGGRGRPARGGDDEAFPRKGQGAHPSPGRRARQRRRGLRGRELCQRRPPARRPLRGRAAAADRGRAPPGHPLAHEGHPPRAGGRRPADRGGVLLHRHRPGRPCRGPPARRPRLQRPLLQHPQRGRAGAGPDDHADARHLPEVGSGASRRVGQVGRQQLGAARQDAGHRRLRQYRRPAQRAGRGAGHAGDLPRPHGEAPPGPGRALLQPGRAPAHGRPGLAARARHAGHARPDRRGRDPDHAQGQLPDQRLARRGGRH